MICRKNEWMFRLVVQFFCFSSSSSDVMLFFFRKLIDIEEMKRITMFVLVFHRTHNFILGCSILEPKISLKNSSKKSYDYFPPPPPPLVVDPSDCDCVEDDDDEEDEVGGGTK